MKMQPYKLLLIALLTTKILIASPIIEPTDIDAKLEYLTGVISNLQSRIQYLETQQEQRLVAIQDTLSPLRETLSMSEHTWLLSLVSIPNNNDTITPEDAKKQLDKDSSLSNYCLLFKLLVNKHLNTHLIISEDYLGKRNIWIEIFIDNKLYILQHQLTTELGFNLDNRDKLPSIFRRGEYGITSYNNTWITYKLKR